MKKRKRKEQSEIEVHKIVLLTALINLIAAIIRMIDN